MEASPTVFVNNRELFDQVKSIDFAEICITSDLEIKSGAVSKTMFTLDDVDDVGVIFKLSTGKKCARCWKYVDEIESTEENSDICSRCNHVLNFPKS